MASMREMRRGEWEFRATLPREPGEARRTVAQKFTGSRRQAEVALAAWAEEVGATTRKAGAQPKVLTQAPAVFGARPAGSIRQLRPGLWEARVTIPASPGQRRRTVSRSAHGDEAAARIALAELAASVGVKSRLGLPPPPPPRPRRPARGRRARPGEGMAWLEAAAAAEPRPGECRLWEFAQTSEGYGHLWVEGRDRLAHVVLLEMVTGPCPEGMEALHSCHQPLCCERSHLSWDSHVENVADMHRAGRASGCRACAAGGHEPG